MFLFYFSFIPLGSISFFLNPLSNTLLQVELKLSGIEAQTDRMKRDDEEEEEGKEATKESIKGQ